MPIEVKRLMINGLKVTNKMSQSESNQLRVIKDAIQDGGRSMDKYAERFRQVLRIDSPLQAAINYSFQQGPSVRRGAPDGGGHPPLRHVQRHHDQGGQAPLLDSARFGGEQAFGAKVCVVTK